MTVSEDFFIVGILCVEEYFWHDFSSNVMLIICKVTSKLYAGMNLNLTN
jgi:hypothetical protein